MAKIPESILIGGRTIDITFEEGFYHNFKNLSTSYHSTSEFRVAEEAPLALKRDHIFTLIYMYISHLVTGIEVVFKGEKWILGKQLFGLIRDNPALIDITKSVFEIPFIKYNGKRFSIAKRPAVMEGLGSIDFNMLAIDVMETTKLDIQWLTLYHEIIHLVRRTAGLALFEDEDEEEEERITNSTAFLLLALFSQNDMTWILDDGDEGLIEYYPSSLSGIA